MANIQALGELINWVDVRNKGVISDNLLGINIDKFFMPSVANIIGTDLSSYKLIRKKQFACNPMHVGRDEKMPIALYMDDSPSIVSPAYFVFEIKDAAKVNPEYLMLWFRRAEFDRECWYHTDGSVRGGITWDEILEMTVPVPSIEEQNELVKSYRDIERRIQIKKEINDNLVATAKASLLKLFIENDNIPKQQIGHFCFEVKAGGTPNRTMHSYWNNGLYPWVKNGEVKNNIIIDTEEFISQSGYENSSAKLVKKHSVLMAMYCVSTPQLAYTDIDVTTNQAVCAMTTRNKLQAAYLYYYLMFFGQDLINDANGSAQINLSKELISNYCIPIPDDAMLSNMNLIENLEYRTQVSKEIVALTSLSQLLIANLSR